MWFARSLRFHEGQILEPGGGSPNGSRRIVLLVHGYNNDKDEAEKSYGALMEKLPHGRESLADQVWWFFWPSYVERLTGAATDAPTTVVSSARGTESNAALSMPTYAWQVLKAREVGRALGRYVRGLERREGVPTEVVFVAHSLGCRVVLEALRELLDGSTEENERDRVPCVCLMAAAVPTFMIDEGERLERAAALPQASYVLHSRSDVVLQWAFRGGQGAASLLVTLGFTGALEDTERADSEGVYPEAVGRNGRPRSVWLRRADTGLGHSGYWKHRSTAPTVLRAISGRSISELPQSGASDDVTWTLPVNPDLPDWKQREMSVGARWWRPTFG